MQTNIETLVDSHLAAYCEPDGPSRMKTIAQVWNAQGRLVDPPFESAGHQGIAEQAAALIRQFPGHRFVRTTGVDGHHEFARYGWALRDGLGNSVLEGVDFVTLDGDGDGRVLMVVGFFGPQERRAEG